MPGVRGLTRGLAVACGTALAGGVLHPARAAAQRVQITQAAPAAAGTTGPNWAAVTVQFSGSYGTTKSCTAACVFLPYDYSPTANALQFTVNGVRQDRLLRVTNTAESCTNNSDGTQSCQRTYTATNGKLTLPPNAPTTLFVQLAPPNASVSQTQSFAVNAASRAHPLISVRPHEGSNRDVSRCAASCFDAVATVSTPAYTSLDVARGVSLVYRSNRGRGTLMLDVVDPSSPSDRPARIGLQLRDAAGHQLGWDNGLTEMQFARSRDTVRVATEFGGGGYGPSTGAYPYEMTATVTSYWTDGDYRILDVPVRLPVEGQWGSPYGAFWTVAGVRTIRGNTDAGRPTMTLLDGTGTVQVFDGQCMQLTPSCHFTPPPGVPDGWIVPGTDGGDSRVAYQQALAGGLFAEYDANGNEVVLITPLGARTTFWWRGDATRLDSIVDPAHQKTTFQYDGNSKLAAIVDPMGRATRVTVDGNGDLVSVTDPLNQVATYAYTSHLLTHYTQVGGGTWDYTYDEAAKLASTTAPAIQTYAGSKRPVTRTLSEVGQRLVGYHAGGGSATNPLPAYLPREAVDFVVDAASDTTAWQADRFGQPFSTRMPDGSVDNVATDENGFPTQSLTANGHDTRAYYNPAKPWLVDSTWDATTNQRVRYTYDASNYDALLTATGDVTPVTNTWSSGRLVSSQTGAGGPKTRYVYLRAGDARPDSVVDQNGHATAYTYASTGLQNTTAAQTPAGTTRYGYDGYGRLQTVTNPRGDTTHTDYDALNRVTATVDGLGHRTQQRYNALYPTAVVDANNATYQSQAVNALGGAQDFTDPTNHQTTFIRDSANRVTQLHDRRGQNVYYGYGRMGDVTGISVSDGAASTFYQDPAGHVSVASNREVLDSTFYDNAGRVTRETHHFPKLAQAGVPADMEVTSRYDVQGRRDTVQLGWVNHWSLPLAQYRFNALGLVDTIVDPAGQTTTIAYNAEGALLSRTLPGGISVSDMPTALHEAGGQTFTGNAKLDTLFGTLLTPDSIGRIRERIGNGTNSGPGYQYDNAGRLTSVSTVQYGTSPKNCTPIYGSTGVVPTTPGEQPTRYSCTGGQSTRTETPSASFTYDAVGNPAYAGAQLADNANRLAVFNGQKYFYDVAGNRWSHTDVDGTFRDRPAWNALGQLVGIQVSNATLLAGAVYDSVDFGYDALGRRVRKTLVGAGRTTYYVWDGDQVAAELDGQGHVTAGYAYYPGTDRPHSVRLNMLSGVGDTTYYYVQGDAPGNVLGLLRPNGTVAAQYQVDAWGQPTAISEPGLQGWKQPYLFAGRAYDRETGLYYNRARYYDPQGRRFLSEDPAGPAGGVNLYVYAGNDPVNNLDPSGTTCATYAEVEYHHYSDGSVEMEILGYETECSGGSGGGSGSQQQPKPPKPKSPKECSDRTATNFTKEHAADATKLAQQLGVPTTFVLAVAGDESFSGRADGATIGNNYFGLHVGAPGSYGGYLRPNGKRSLLAGFDPSLGFMGSGQSFVTIADKTLSGVADRSDTAAFFTAMHSRFGLGDSTGRYVHKLTVDVRDAQTRLNCP
ncbi:hypothetical protein tb265_50030 [Gemmatimonadetes bacterium T265]|nr:hypothetical protein tb265_50030 [Gemmatimonadetes bacterium T265]